VGYVVAGKRVAGPVGLMNDLFSICAPTPLQWGLARALEIGDEYYANLPAGYTVKRDMLAAALAEAHFQPSVPEGAYYMLAEIPEGVKDGAECARLLLDQARVACVPGTAFFESETGKRMVRFCFAKDFDSLEEACKRIRAFKPAAVAV